MQICYDRSQQYRHGSPIDNRPCGVVCSVSLHDNSSALAKIRLGLIPLGLSCAILYCSCCNSQKVSFSIICGSPHHFKKLARQMVIWLLVKLYKSKVHFKSNHLIRYNTVHQSLFVLTFCLCSLTSNLKPLYLHACTYSCSKIPIETQLGFVHHTQGLGRIKLTRYGDLRYSSPVQAEGKILERKLKSFPRLVI